MLIVDKVDAVLSKLKLNYNRQFDCFKVSLCINQIQKMLNLLTKTNGLSSGTVEKIMSYISICIDRCADKIGDLLNFDCTTATSNCVENDEACLGRFISKVDDALHLLIVFSASRKNIDECSVDDKCCEWKALVDDLLFQAVTVAKISSGVDSNEITATCHKILKECQELEFGDSLDLSMWKLHCEILGDALMQLERRVSSALLRLLLKVFSDARLPLKRLIHSIKSSNCKLRNVKDIDKVVQEFDYHNDCIHHLCLFALAFSDDKKCLLPISSCLASMESLDDSLVPAVLDVYMDPTNPDKLYYLKFLVDHWLSEVNSLEPLLDSIIDPTSFTTIALQSIQCDLERVKSVADFMIESTNGDAYKIESSSYYGILNNIVTEALRLLRHLNFCNNKNISELKTLLKLVINECKEILKVPFNSNDYKSIVTRTLKRFDLLVSVICKISKCLSSATSGGNEQNHIGISSCDSFQDTTSLLNQVEVTYPNSVKDLPVDITLTSVDKCNESRKIGRGDFFQNIYFANLHKKKRVDEGCMKVHNGVEVEHYVSGLMTKHAFANTLYEPSPRKKSNGTRCGLTLHSMLESTQLLSIQHSSDSSCGLEITDILENLEIDDNKSDTVSTVDNDEHRQVHIESCMGITVNTAGTSTVLSLLPSDISSDYKPSNQLNRTAAIMADLKLIENKLNLLKQ